MVPSTRIFINLPYGGGRLRSAHLVSAAKAADKDQELIAELRSCGAQECYVVPEDKVIFVTAKVASETDEQFLDSVVACVSRHGYQVDDTDKLFGRST